MPTTRLQHSVKDSSLNNKTRKQTQMSEHSKQQNGDFPVRDSNWVHPKHLLKISLELLQHNKRTLLMDTLALKKKESKAVPLHATEALWLRGGIAPTLS
jgi:hypothetical protein